VFDSLEHHLSDTPSYRFVWGWYSIPPDPQRLILKGRELLPHRMLADYAITKETTIHLAMRLHGDR